MVQKRMLLPQILGLLALGACYAEAVLPPVSTHAKVYGRVVTSAGQPAANALVLVTTGGGIDCLASGSTDHGGAGIYRVSGQTDNSGDYAVVATLLSLESVEHWACVQLDALVVQGTDTVLGAAKGGPVRFSPSLNQMLDSIRVDLMLPAGF